jgi:pyrroline-5-carboxylate reductase
MSEYYLGVIGGGNMAEAMLTGALTGGSLSGSAVLVAEPNEQRRSELASRLGVACTGENPAAAACPIVLLAVKPQVLPGVLAEVAPSVTDRTLVISIAAGITCGSISAGLGGRGRIVRVMPNTPMLVGESASGYCPGPGATEEDLHLVEQFCTAGGGLAVRVDERMMDAVTAVSGSGPAYVFYLVEAMVRAGEIEGLSREQALRLAAQTLIGSGVLLARTGLDPGELRERVTSPGGTTEAALATLNAAGVGESLVQAIRNAARRSRDLAR